MGVGSTRTYDNITPAMWSCIQSYNTGYESTYSHDQPPGEPGCDTGEVKTKSPVGEVAVKFVFNPSKSTLQYTITAKPWIVMDSSVFGGIEKTIAACRGR